MSNANPALLFCQRNNRLWVTSLIGAAVLVLGLALWLAFEDGKFKGFQPENELAIADTNMVQGLGAPGASSMQQVAFNSFPQGPALQQPMAQQPIAPTVTRGGGADTASHLQGSFNEVSTMMRPRVVSISAIRPNTRPIQLQVNPNAPRFVDPFNGVPDAVIGGVAMESVGSGVIIDPAGYVVTNDHVVNGATSIMLTQFGQSQPLAAQLVATDPQRDLALLKIDAPGPFPAAKLANSNEVKIGDWVLAVGNPFGLGHSVTAGIVSSRRSSVEIAGVQYSSLLQTDAPINQGSSGGPLVNLQGKVVGVNTAIYAPTGVFNGTGFAIPSNKVGSFLARVVDAQTNTGAPTTAVVGPAAPMANTASPGRLGLQGTNVSGPLATKLGLPAAQGLFVNSVAPGSPADGAGIRRGDVVVSIAGTPVRDSASLRATLDALPMGQMTTIVAIRDREQVTRNLVLGAL